MRAKMHFRLLFLMVFFLLQVKQSMTKLDIDPKKLKDIYMEMFSAADKDPVKKENQHVLALLLSPHEVNMPVSELTNKFNNREFRVRFGVYNNLKKNMKRKENIHGEIRVLEKIPNMFKAYKDAGQTGVGILVIYSTYIPCHRVCSKLRTFCASSLRFDLEKRKLNNDPHQYQLELAFATIYTTVGDFTDLPSALMNIYAYPQTDMCARIFIDTNIGFMSKPKEGRYDQTIFQNRNTYVLSDCFGPTTSVTKDLLKKFWGKTGQYPKTFVQDLLVYCIGGSLEVQVLQCIRPKPGSRVNKCDGVSCINSVCSDVYCYQILANWINNKMRECVQNDCKGCRGTLESNLLCRLKLEKCLLKSESVGGLDGFPWSYNGKAPTKLLEMCVKYALIVDEVGCPNDRGQEKRWVSCNGPWDKNYCEPNAHPNSANLQPSSFNLQNMANGAGSPSGRPRSRSQDIY